jgi:WD40 repeat protein
MLAVGSAESDDYASGEGSVALWDVSDPAHSRRIAEPLTALDSTGSFALAFSADGTLLIVDATPPILLDVRNPTAPRRVATLPGEQIVDVDTTRGGRTIAVLLGARPGVTDAGSPSGVRLWDVTDPHALHQIGPALVGHGSDVYYAALSAHGDRLVTADHLLNLSVQNHPKAIVWDLRDPEHPVQQGPPVDPTSTAFGYFDVALDPEGRILAIGAQGGIASLWTLDDRSRARPLARPIVGPGDRINDLTFAPDGTTLALAGGDGQVALWNLQPVHDLRAHSLRYACEISSGGLDHVEWQRYLPNRHYEATCDHV